MSSLWPWATESSWREAVGGAMLDWMSRHKRELGHIGQRDVSELASHIRCRSYSVSTSGSPSGNADNSGAVVSSTLESPNAIRSTRESHRVSLLKFDMRALVSNGDLALSFKIGHMGSTDEEYQPLISCDLPEVGDPILSLSLDAMERSRQLILPALDGTEVWAEFLMAVPFVPNEVQDLITVEVVKHCQLAAGRPDEAKWCERAMPIGKIRLSSSVDSDAPPSKVTRRSPTLVDEHLRAREGVTRILLPRSERSWVEGGGQTKLSSSASWGDEDASSSGSSASGPSPRC